MPRHLFLQDRPAPSGVANGPFQVDRQQPQARVLYTHPQRTDVLIEPTRDGHDLHVICERHQWAAPPVVRFSDCGMCPQCLAEIDAEHGRARYRQLQQAVIREGR